MKRPYLTVVMPAYNEEINFKAGVLKPTLAYLRNKKYSWRMIFVDDGSTDETRRHLKKFCQENKEAKLITIPHGGRAAAMTRGMLAATGKYVLYTDFDQSTPIDEMEKFLEAQETGYDIVIGARGAGNEKVRIDEAFLKLRAEVFAWIVRGIFLPGIIDINCGFKTYTNEAAKRIFSALVISRPRDIKGAYMGAIDTEILYLARLYKYKIKQIPVSWIRRPTHGHMLLEPIRVFIDVIRIWIVKLRGGYNS